MNQTSETETNKTTTAQEPPAIRVALLADDVSLRQYGPVLRRLTVGIFDEVASLSLVCRGRSRVLNFVPSPPINIISDVSSLYETKATRIDNANQVILYTPRINPGELLKPGKKNDRLAAELAERKVTIIHALSERMEKLAAELAKKLDIPYVTSLLSENHHHLNIRESRCSHLVPCYSHVARELRLKYPKLANKIHLVEIGTHISTSASCYDFKDRWPQIFCCCPLEKNMGIPELIKAAKILKEAKIDFQLMISGEGKMEYEYRKLVSSLELSKNVHFIEPIDHIVLDNEAFRKVFRMSDIYVQCRPARIWHPELLEAMSAGNAVVTVGTTENNLIVNEKTALTAEIHNSEDLAEKIKKLIEDKDYARNLAISCQQYIKKHYLASDMVEKLIKVYRATLGIE